MKNNNFYYVIRFDYEDGSFDYLKSYSCLGLMPECSCLLNSYRFLSLDCVKTELEFIHNFAILPNNCVVARVVKINLREISFICK